MTFEEIKLRRLAGQHLLQPADTQTVVKDLCGVQAQFLSHGLHGLSIRSDIVDTAGLIKSWTNRGTMHLFSAEDLPLFLHQDRQINLRPVDTMETDAYLSADRKAYFAALILDAVGAGIEEREALKALCTARGMTDSEAESIFNPWGGLLRALCEEGKLCHKVQEKKAFQLCPAFEPMEKEAAQLELLRRYFTNFGPATVKDASYFFGWTQGRVKNLLSKLPAETFCLDNRVYHHTGSRLPDQDIPRCLFLAGFDQLMLGYEKTEGLFLPPEHLRDIFTLAGIVRPAVLVNGTVAGWWNLKDRKLKIALFTDTDRTAITDAADALWADLKSVTIE